MVLSIRWGNKAGLKKFDTAMNILGSTGMNVIGNRAVNWTGDRSRTKVKVGLRQQTGLKAKVITKAVRTKRSNPITLTYQMDASGGDIALKYFGARETRKGVSAAPFGKRKVFAGTFTKGGRFPGRKALGMGGQVFKRTSAARGPIEKQLSGVIIPAEMVKGPTKIAFATSLARLDTRMAHELRVATDGVVG